MRIVQKFGGTSVADITRIQAVAERIKHEHDKGHQVVVVVSAMAGVTNQLLNLAQTASQGMPPYTADHDIVLASGEQVSSGLLSMILNRMGLSAEPLLAWQIPITTDDVPTNARILNVKTDRLTHLLAQGTIPVVAGYQGVSSQGRLTTLGRGGSDTTAVALAAFLKADLCDIYTDVDGVYSADPRVVEKARRLSHISYEEMLALSTHGAKVLQARSVEMAMQHQVRVRVLSSFSALEKGEGTEVVSLFDLDNRSGIRGIALNMDESKITLCGIADDMVTCQEVFEALDDAHIDVEMIIKNVGADNLTDLTFTLAKAEAQKALNVLEPLRFILKYRLLQLDQENAKISIVGLGVPSHVGVLRRIFNTLTTKGIHAQVVAASGLKISILVHSEQAHEALIALHTTFDLDREEH